MQGMKGTEMFICGSGLVGRAPIKCVLRRKSRDRQEQEGRQILPV